MRISLLTLGCKVNQAETAAMETALMGSGHELVGLREGPELCVINTCTVTSKSDYQSRQLIRRACRTGARVMVTGCYSEINREEVARMEGVERVIENSNKDNIIKLIQGSCKSKALNIKGMRTRNVLKVQDGCDFSCSYCLIQRARGRSRSLRPDEALSRVQAAVSQGAREVVLAGIHLGLYGRDLTPPVSLEYLLEEILRKTALERVRLSSLEIGEIGERLIDLMGDERVCGHLHPPLQSGDDRVLKLMNRNYDTRYFTGKIEAIASRLGDIALGTDIIAGFPGETEEAFLNTCRMAGGLPFTYIHVFPYSARPGTAAFGMTDIVGDSARKERASVLRDIGIRKREEYISRQVGRVLDVLVEERTSGGVWRGTSGNYLRVTVHGEDCLRGDIVSVGIEGTGEGGLYGNQIFKQ